MNTGHIGISTENIFPVIKKFLYSDHEIFLREVVANAVDASQKLKTLAANNEFSGELGDLTIHVKVDKEAGTLTISDRGVGMTAEEVDKYINQIAFSGATEFLEKYKDDTNAIIGHFGLGFYSTFMVAKEVEIITKSHISDAKAVKWTCDGTPNYQLEEVEKADRGTDIVLHISDDCQEFLELNHIRELLKKYCRFLPIAIACGKETEWKDGKNVETEKDFIVNDTNPLWTKTPSSLKDEDYKKFYSELYPMQDEPLFWIHLNVDFPFHLTGVLYFPKIKSNLDVQRNKISLYCNQVYVTDQVNNIVPDFLTLLHGVIDSPDIPLNVSRSYLQSDGNVKKISAHITKKVSDKLSQIFKNDRKQFEEKWDDLKLFIHYGFLTDNDFYERSKKFLLFKDTENKYYSLDEYATLVKENQTDKNGQTGYLYATNIDEQYSYIQAAENKGYNVLLLDGQLEGPLAQMLEQKLEKTSFARVDSDTIDRLIQKEDIASTQLEAADEKLITSIFDCQAPKDKDVNFSIQTNHLGENNAPILLTRSEYMRRMKEAAKMQPGMQFYGEMPDMYNIVLNVDHAIINNVLEQAKSTTKEKIQPIENEIKGLEARKNVIEDKLQNDKDLSDDRKKELREDLDTTKKSIETENTKYKEIVTECATSNPQISQLIDLALLQNGLLKGKELADFLKRSYDLMK